MVSPASAFIPSLSGLGAIATLLVVLLAILGLLTIALGIYFLVDERLLATRNAGKFKFEPGPIDRGVALVDYVNEKTLHELAAHHGIETPPAAIEEERRNAVSGGLPKGILKGRSEVGTKTTHQPHNNPGDLIKKILRYLDDRGELNKADLVDADDVLIEPVPDFSDPTITRNFFESWLGENFPSGLDGVEAEEMAMKLGSIRSKLSEESLRTHLRALFEGIKQNPETVLFLEGEWDIEGEHGSLDLSRTDVLIEAGAEGTPRSIRMPSETSIKARLEGSLTDHGKNRMVGVSRPVRACVLATYRQYNPDTGCLELVPIGIFQRVLSRNGRTPSSMLRATPRTRS